MSSRVHNANLAYACARCGRRFPRMYREDDTVVCRTKECRPVRAPTMGEQSGLTPGGSCRG